MDFINKKIKIFGQRIYLRILEESDATKEYCDWLNDLEINRFLDTKGATIEKIRHYILKKNGQKNILFFGIFLNDNAKHIGTIKLEPINLILGNAAISIMVGDRNYWGKGLGGEAIKILINYAFKDLALKEIYLGVNVGNEAAINSYKKIGFKEYILDNKFREFNKNLYNVIKPKLSDDIIMVLNKI